MGSPLQLRSHNIYIHDISRSGFTNYIFTGHFPFSLCIMAYNGPLPLLNLFLCKTTHLSNKCTLHIYFNYFWNKFRYMMWHCDATVPCQDIAIELYLQIWVVKIKLPVLNHKYKQVVCIIDTPLLLQCHLSIIKNDIHYQLYSMGIECNECLAW